jgi:hypothetical protein
MLERNTTPRRAAIAATIAAALALTLSATATPDALAGSYVVTACGAAPGGVNNSWAPSANHANVTAYTNACAPISGGLIARAAANGSSVPANAASSWTFTRPNAETVITGLDLSAEIYRYGGDSFNSWGAGLSDDAGAFLWGDTSSGYLHVGTNSGAYIPIGVNNRISIQLGVRCANGAGCTTASSGDATQNYSRARTALYGARVTLSNWTAPSVSGRRGALWSTNGWVNGTQGAGFDAGDEVGVQRIALAVDGQEQASDSSCDFTYTVPCPVNRSLDASFNTAGFADGVHTLWFRATDSAGNVGTDSRWIYIDNTAPAAPRDARAVRRTQRPVADDKRLHSHVREPEHRRRVGQHRQRRRNLSGRRAERATDIVVHDGAARRCRGIEHVQCSVAGQVPGACARS